MLITKAWLYVKNRSRQKAKACRRFFLTRRFFPARLSGAQGVSLVEVLVASAILAALLVPVFLIFQFSTRSVYRSTNDILATSLAMSKMEELKSLPYFKLENILLGLHPDDPYRLSNTLPPQQLTGPFEQNPPLPAIAEPSFYQSGGTTFHRYVFLSYFPQGNPNPNLSNFVYMKKRIKIRVHIFWKDRLSTSVMVDQDLSFEAIVADENYNPKPLLNKYLSGN